MRGDDDEQLTTHQNEIILTGAQVVTDSEIFSGTCVIRNGKIAEVDQGPSQLAQAIDLEGDYLIPGLIDIHTDNLEKHLEPRPGVHWPVLAALQVHDRMMATAGITTVFDSLCVGQDNHVKQGRRDALVQALEAVSIAQDDALLKSDHLFHLRCEVSSPDVLDQLDVHVENPLVRMISLMDHTPGQRQWSNLDAWFRYHSRTHSREELTAQMDFLLSEQEKHAAPNRAAVLERAKAHGIPLASHDDTTVEHVMEAAADGIHISEFPTTLEAARAAHENGMVTVMGGPNVVKGGSHSGNVSAHDVAKAGLLDGLSSDYVPISMLHAAFILFERHGIDLVTAVGMVTSGPADMAELPDRGRIKQGLRADLVWVKHYHHMPAIRGVWLAGQQVA
ncbi:MAG: alpha-D-ribose 1-methylphosphonate 5-triphosphate diphosphatase [Magnetovibrionaceae bacterium]